MKVIIIWFVCFFVDRGVLSKYINPDTVIKQSKDSVEKETTLEVQLDQLLRQFPRQPIKQSDSTKSVKDSSEENSDDDTIETKINSFPSQRQRIGKSDPNTSSSEVVYGKLVFFPSSLPVDPTHRSSTEVETAFLTQFLPSVASNWKETTTAPPKNNQLSKKRRKNRNKNKNRPTKEEKLLESVIQLAEKYGTDAKLSDMLKKLCGNSTVSCKRIQKLDEDKKVEDDKKSRKKQNSKQTERKNERRKKPPKDKIRKSKNMPSANEDTSDPKWNKLIRAKTKTNEKRKNSKSNDVILLRQKDDIISRLRQQQHLLEIDKPRSKKWRHPSGNDGASTVAPPNDLEEELIELETKTEEEKVNRRISDHRRLKNSNSQRLQQHIREQIELHRRRINRQLIKDK